MSDMAKDRDRGALMFVPKSPFLIWLNLAVTLIIAGIASVSASPRAWARRSSSFTR